MKRAEEALTGSLLLHLQVLWYPHACAHDTTQFGFKETP